jgi:translation initiation factor 2B subunit (eIF-2B alpha/beta/delta family)
MKGKGHIQSFNEHQENLNIFDVRSSKINESMDDMEKEIINGQIDYAIQVLKSMFEVIKGYNISTEEFNEILSRKIKKLESEKFDI